MKKIAHLIVLALVFFNIIACSSDFSNKTTNTTNTNTNTNGNKQIESHRHNHNDKDSSKNKSINYLGIYKYVGDEADTSYIKITKNGKNLYLIDLDKNKKQTSKIRIAIKENGEIWNKQTKQMEAEISKDSTLNRRVGRAGDLGPFKKIN